MLTKAYCTRLAANPMEGMASQNQAATTWRFEVFQLTWTPLKPPVLLDVFQATNGKQTSRGNGGSTMLPWRACSGTDGSSGIGSWHSFGIPKWNLETKGWGWGDRTWTWNPPYLFQLQNFVNNFEVLAKWEGNWENLTLKLSHFNRLGTSLILTSNEIFLKSGLMCMRMEAL